MVHIMENFSFFSRKSPLKNEEFFGGKVVSCDNGANIEIRFDDQVFDQEGVAKFSLKENGITITLHRKVEPSQDSAEGNIASATHKEGAQCEGQNVDVGNAIGSPNKEVDETAKSTGALAGQKSQLHTPAPTTKSLRTMLFDNVSWKEPHSMSLEELSALNQKMRYGEIRELKEEVVAFEAGTVSVSADRIAVDTEKWNPEKGGGSGQFHVELPINGIRLSLFVFRPVSELLIFKKVEGVPYPKDDEDSGCGNGGSFKWVYASTRGPSHRNSDKLYRDDDVRGWHDDKNDTLYLVVADGAGSAKYAREGSRIAVEETINYFIGKPLSSGVLVSSQGYEIAKREVHYAVRNVLTMIDDRCDKIKQERNETNLTRRYLHTTLNLAIVQRGFNEEFKILTFAIGDGAVVFCQNDGSCTLLSVPDRGEFASQTAFITSNGIIPELGSPDCEKFYERRFEEATISADKMKNGYLALMTDGVSEDVEDWGRFIEETKFAIEKMDAVALLDWLNNQIERNLDDKTLVLASQVNQ